MPRNCKLTPPVAGREEGGGEKYKSYICTKLHAAPIRKAACGNCVRNETVRKEDGLLARAKEYPDPETTYRDR